MPEYKLSIVPRDGDEISFDDGKLSVPDRPIIPFIEGDGTGPDIWRASVRVFDAAVEKAFGGERSIKWMEVFAGEKSYKQFTDWLPQETILFDRARVSRAIDIDLAETASLLLCEIVVFGRAAMGERMLHGEFVDRWRLRRGGRLVFAETVRLDGEIGEKLSQPAVAKGGVAIGTVLIVPGDEALVERIRGASESFGGEVGISCWNGFAMARFCAQDAARLRADMVAVLGCASGSALPRLWLN